MTQSPDHYGAELPFSYLRDLNIVYHNAAHLKSLVDDVLDMARIEAAQMTVNPEQTELGPFVQDVANTIRGLIESKGLSLTVEIEADLPTLWIDRTRIRQVFFNLLNNATRFTDSGGIRVEVCHRANEVIFSISDTGIGIAAEDLPRVFEVFRQVDAYQRGGTGLGLAISKRFVELHGGKIWATSEIGKGSTFFFSLPVDKVDPEDGIDSFAPRLLGQAEKQTPRVKERIVVAVTQSHTAASLLTRYLQGCRMMLASDLEHAYQITHKIRPEVIVIDTVYEHLDSVSLHHLSQTWQTADLPIIACPLPGVEPIRQHLAVDGYLTKPIARDHLWTVLRPFGENIDKVLIVDDNRDFVRLLGRMLDHPLRRYRVLSAYNGQEGLELLMLQQPDLIFLDLEMPVMNGYQFLERIKTMPRYQHIPVIVVTGQDGTNEFEVLDGTFSMARKSGIRANEIVQLIQTIVDRERFTA